MSALRKASQQTIEDLLAEYDMQDSSFADDLRAALAEPQEDHSVKNSYELIMKWADIYAAETGNLYAEAARDPSKTARMSDERTMLGCVVAQCLSTPPPKAEPQEPDEVKQIAEALRQVGLTLIRTGAGFRVADLGRVEAQTAPQPKVEQQEPVAAQHRFRHPQKNMPDWSVWQPCEVAQRPAWEIDSQGYEVEYRALYTAPQPRKRLTRDTTMELANATAGQCWMDEAHIQRFARAIEAAVWGEKT